MKVKNDHRSKFSNLSNWKEEAWKNQGFNGIRTRDLRDTGASYRIKEGAFHLESVTQREVLRTLKQLRTDCSTGPDQLPARFVKLTGPLTTIINTCISKLYSPRVWKLARISPIPKVDTPVTEDHLRPVSIIPVLSKVLKSLLLPKWLISALGNLFWETPSRVSLRGIRPLRYSEV